MNVVSWRISDRSCCKLFSNESGRSFEGCSDKIVEMMESKWILEPESGYEVWGGLGKVSVFVVNIVWDDAIFIVLFAWVIKDFDPVEAISTSLLRLSNCFDSSNGFNAFLTNSFGTPSEL